MIYYDSLGWSMPKALKQKVKPIIDTVCELTEKFVAFPMKGRVFHAHTEGHINSSGFHECTISCFVYYTRQLCFNICGIVAAVMSAIALLSPSLWDVVFKARRHMEQLNAFLWLSEPTRHSMFLRKFLLETFMKKSFDLGSIGLNKETSQQLSKIVSQFNVPLELSKDTTEDWKAALTGPKSVKISKRAFNNCSMNMHDQNRNVRGAEKEKNQETKNNSKPTLNDSSGKKENEDLKEQRFGDTKQKSSFKGVHKAMKVESNDSNKGENGDIKEEAFGGTKQKSLFKVMKVAVGDSKKKENDNVKEETFGDTKQKVAVNDSRIEHIVKHVDNLGFFSDEDEKKCDAKKGIMQAETYEYKLDSSFEANSNSPMDNDSPQDIKDDKFDSSPAPECNSQLFVEVNDNSIEDTVKNDDNLDFLSDEDEKKSDSEKEIMQAQTDEYKQDSSFEANSNSPIDNDSPQDIADDKFDSSPAPDGNSQIFVVGRRFSSVEEIEEAKGMYEEQYFCELWKRDVRSLQAAKKRVPNRVAIANPALKYYQMKLSCKFGGKPVEKRDNRQRKTKSFRQGCPFEVYLSLSLDGQALVVASVSDSHNHFLSKQLHKHLPRQRTLPNDIREEMEVAIKLKANNKLLQQKIENTTGKKVIFKDIYNIKARTKADMNRNDIEAVMSFLREKDGSRSEVIVDSENDFKGLFYQDS